VVPDDLRYTADHEWLRPADGPVRIGITHYAQDSLGDIVYVALPSVGTEVTKRASLGEIESTKSVADLYAPVTGTVTAVNDRLRDAPELVNQDPYGEGWIAEIDPADRLDVDGLLDASAYRALLG
jgi:glycine cleavage system H protein